MKKSSARPLVQSRIPVIFLTSGLLALSFGLAMQLNDINGVPMGIAGAVLGFAGLIMDRKNN